MMNLICQDPPDMCITRREAETLHALDFEKRSRAMKEFYGLKLRKKSKVIEDWMDEFGNCIFYISRQGTWTLYRWIQLSNGIWKTSRVDLQYGYWREHNYDIEKCRLMSEIDKMGNKNLLDKRMTFNSSDTEISEEIQNPNGLQSLF